jgi:hypothetical protein
MSNAQLQWRSESRSGSGRGGVDSVTASPDTLTAVP